MKMKARFSLSESGDGKRLYVEGPKNFSLGIEIDHDDVDHALVEIDAQKLIEILEEHWPK